MSQRSSLINMLKKLVILAITLFQIMDVRKYFSIPSKMYTVFEHILYDSKGGEGYFRIVSIFTSFYLLEIFYIYIIFL